ncbi:MAG: M14 family metallopeptidase [Minisyncoccia bacterium]
MKKIILITIAVVVVVALGAYVINKNFSREDVLKTESTEKTEQTKVIAEAPKTEEKVVEEKVVNEKQTVIGTSVEDRTITAYHYGTGDTELLFIGGIHGGYSWNTTLVAYELMNYLDKNPNAIPRNVRVTVIPVLNPDGLYKISGTEGVFAKADITKSLDETIPGRFNAHTVDLNRNFDCDWKSSGVWQSKTVSGGSKAFSEPESQALREYVGAHKPSAVVAWYSAVGGVFSSSCHNGILPETLTLTNVYAEASKYPAFKDFDFYAITGDMVNWFAKNDIPAISVLLTTHDDIEWSKNKAGIDALLAHYAE